MHLISAKTVIVIMFQCAKSILKHKKTRSKSKIIKFDLVLLKSNQTIGEKYRVKMKSEVFREADEVDQQWAKFKTGITKADRNKYQESKEKENEMND